MLKVSVMLDVWEKMLSKAQMPSAQSGDIEDVLKSSGLFDVAQQVSPLLDQAGVPGNASVEIGLTIDRGLNPSFPVITNPPSPTARALSGLLKQHFAGPIKKALTNAKLNVTDTVSLKWLKF
jgi:hypothetical protein